MASEPTKPRLIAHHASRSWTSFWYDDSGAKRTKRFGREGEVNKPQALAKFNDWMLTQWRRFDHVRNPASASGVFTVRHLTEEYLEHAQTLHRKPSYLEGVEAAMRILAHTHGDAPADALTNPQLASLRDAMIFKPNGKARAMKTVNYRLQAMKQAFKWAREKGKVSANTLVDILAVSLLKRGSSPAKDPKEVRPLDWSVVQTTLAYLPPTVQAMVNLQWLTGMRSDEICSMRPCDIEAGGEVWFYRPATHKTERWMKEKIIPLGPQARRIIEPFLTRDTTAYIFSPAEAQQQRREARHATRKTPLSYGNTPGSNLCETPQHPIGLRYDKDSYRKAIRHACRAVEKAMRKEDPQASFPAWHPHQLRHSFANRHAKAGVDERDIQAYLGHSNEATTAHYAGQYLGRATSLALAVG